MKFGISALRFSIFAASALSLSCLLLSSCADSPEKTVPRAPVTYEGPLTVAPPGVPTKLPQKSVTATSAMILIKDMQIGYAPKQADLKEQDKANLKKLASLLLKNAKLFQHVEIIGHADKEGSENFILDLSKKRALTISEVLKAAGLANSQIQTSWRGDTEPLSAQASPPNLPTQNRRVELKFYGVQRNQDFEQFLEDINKI